MPPAAAIGASVVGGIAGNVIQGNANRSAANMQSDAENTAANKEQDVFNQQSGFLNPYQKAGSGALSQMQDPYFQQSFTPQDFANNMDPAYQFNLQQGQQAIERSAAAKGGLASGGTLKDLNNYAQGMASNEYQNAYNRFNNDQSQKYGRLSTLAGIGQNANSQFDQAAQNYATNYGNDIMGAANAQANAVTANGKMWGGMLSGLGSGGGNTYSQMNYMNSASNLNNAKAAAV